MMRKIRIRTDELRKASPQWWRVWPESRFSTVIAALGITILCIGMALYLLRNPRCFGFLAAGPIVFLFALLLDIAGGHRPR